MHLAAGNFRQNRLPAREELTLQGRERKAARETYTGAEAVSTKGEAHLAPTISKRDAATAAEAGNGE